MKTSDFGYDLPEELIAQDPLSDRSSSRLMALNRQTGEIKHDTFKHITDYLKPGDCLVINDTKVIPARLFGHRDKTGGKCEVLLLKRLSEHEWDTIVKPGKNMKPGQVVNFGEPDEQGKYPLVGVVEEIIDEGDRRIRFVYDGIFEEVLLKLGEMPLPPYIHHKLKDRDRYNTVYAQHNGSAAAPTAGLHFTQDILQEIEAKGVQIAHVTLHVGLGTFRPVKVDDVTNHHMHSERYIVSEEAARVINDTKAAGHRVICVGTTSCRTIESAANEEGRVQPGSDWTSIFIYPGYEWKVMDGLITNFHLPESTLIMLVSAFAGKEAVLGAYETAVRERYRFFSFGDAMVIV